MPSGPSGLKGRETKATLSPYQGEIEREWKYNQISVGSKNNYCFIREYQQEIK
jgi:hypothetical protein